MMTPGMTMMLGSNYKDVEDDFSNLYCSPIPKERKDTADADKLLGYNEPEPNKSSWQDEQKNRLSGILTNRRRSSAVGLMRDVEQQQEDNANDFADFDNNNLNSAKGQGSNHDRKPRRRKTLAASGGNDATKQPAKVYSLEGREDEDNGNHHQSKKRHSRMTRADDLRGSSHHSGGRQSSNDLARGGGSSHHARHELRGASRHSSDDLRSSRHASNDLRGTSRHSSDDLRGSRHHARQSSNDLRNSSHHAKGRQSLHRRTSRTNMHEEQQQPSRLQRAGSNARFEPQPSRRSLMQRRASSKLTMEEEPKSKGKSRAEGSMRKARSNENLSLKRTKSNENILVEGSMRKARSNENLSLKRTKSNENVKKTESNENLRNSRHQRAASKKNLNDADVVAKPAKGPSLRRVQTLDCKRRSSSADDDDDDDDDDQGRKSLPLDLYNIGGKRGGGRRSSEHHQMRSIMDDLDLLSVDDTIDMSATSASSTMDLSNVTGDISDSDIDLSRSVNDAVVAKNKSLLNLGGQQQQQHVELSRTKVALESLAKLSSEIDNTTSTKQSTRGKKGSSRTATEDHQQQPKSKLDQVMAIQKNWKTASKQVSKFELAEG